MQALPHRIPLPIVAMAMLLAGCPTEEIIDDPPADDDGPYTEIELEATDGYLARKAEYLEYCDAANGPGEGGLYGQVCRIAMGHEVDPEPIAESCEPVNAREDTADFKVAALVRMLYLDRANPTLDADSKALIEQTVLDFKYWIDEPGSDQMCYWTENHQGLFHSNELLAGQLFPDQVFTNDGTTGAEHAEHAAALAERWLDFRGRFGFSEWHSNVYFNEDLPAAANLAEFAEDEAIRTKAAAVLDLMALDMATNYYQGKFATVHGRTYESKFLDGLSDSTSEAAWMMLGLGEYTSSGNFSATFLATSDRYWIPGVLEDIAAEAAPSLEHRQSDGIDVADGPDWGVGYEDQDDIIFWAGMSALVAPEVIEGTYAMVEDLDLWDGFLFGDLPDELMDILDMAIANDTLDDLATELEPLSRGIALENMNTYVFRTPHYQLAGGQDYNPSYWSSQTQMWQATLDDEAYVFTSFPSDLGDAAGDQEIAGQWIGSWLPRVTLAKNVGVIQYRKQDVPLAETFFSSDHTHAYFPKARFDEVVEEPPWIMGRRGDGYVALYSANPTAWSEDNDYELDAEGETNVWIVELGSADEHGSFDAFVEAIAAADVEVGDSVTYASPSLGTVTVDWDGTMTVGGDPVDLGPYPRWSNTYAEVEFGDPVTNVDLGDLRLQLDFEQGRRRLLQYTADE